MKHLKRFESFGVNEFLEFNPSIQKYVEKIEKEIKDAKSIGKTHITVPIKTGMGLNGDNFGHLPKKLVQKMGDYFKSVGYKITDPNVDYPAIAISWVKKSDARSSSTSCVNCGSTDIYDTKYGDKIDVKCSHCGMNRDDYGRK